MFADGFRRFFATCVCVRCCFDRLVCFLVVRNGSPSYLLCTFQVVGFLVWYSNILGLSESNLAHSCVVPLTG